MPKAGKQFNKKDEWYTPKKVVDFFGPFDYDPATTETQAKRLGIKNYDTIETDGLSTDWSKYKKIWLNPPFTKKFEFLKKAIKSGCHVYILFPIESMTTILFHEIMKEYDGGYIVWVPNGRVKFDCVGPKSLPAFGSVVIELRGKRKIIKYWRLNA